MKKIWKWFKSLFKKKTPPTFDWNTLMIGVDASLITSAKIDASVIHVCTKCGKFYVPLDGGSDTLCRTCSILNMSVIANDTLHQCARCGILYHIFEPIFQGICPACVYDLTSRLFDPPPSLRDWAIGNTEPGQITINKKPVSIENPIK